MNTNKTDRVWPLEGDEGTCGRPGRNYKAARKRKDLAAMPEWIKPLSGRLQEVLRRHLIDTKEKALEAIASETLKSNLNAWRKTYNYGKKAEGELMKALGLPVEAHRDPIKVCFTPETYRSKRKELALTQFELAEILGVPVGFIHHRESGKKKITQEAYLALDSLSRKRPIL
jgi:DNA-binding transcriptional regulator YiaG